MSPSAPFWRADIDPAAEPRRILIDRGEWRDDTRGGRIVPYKIYYPDLSENDAEIPLPAVIWSHGLGGTQDGAGFIGRFMAAHGYVHIHIGHDGTNDSLWRGKPGHPWDNIRKAVIPFEDVRNRYRDIGFVLSVLPDRVGLCHIDKTRLGMSGHSFGALTAQIAAGQKTGRGTDIEDYSHDDAFTAAIAYSPVPNARLQQDDETVYGSIRLPLLHLTGSEDHSPLDGPIQHLRDAIFDHAGHNGAMQMAVIMHGVDHMVFNGSRGQLPDYPGMDRHKDQIKIIALAWWDAFLKDDPGAKAWLRNGLWDYIDPDSWVSIKNDNESMT